MAEPAPGVPAQTITIPADKFLQELVDRLNKTLDGFVVYRSAFYVRLRHLECTEVLLTKVYLPLLELIQVAMDHDCPGSPD